MSSNEPVSIALTDDEVVLASLEAIIPAIEGREVVATENDDAAAIRVA